MNTQEASGIKILFTTNKILPNYFIASNILLL